MIRGLVKEARIITCSLRKGSMSNSNTSSGLLMNYPYLRGIEHEFLLSIWEGVMVDNGSHCFMY